MNERYLKWWLLLVALLRSISVLSGYFHPATLHRAVTSLELSSDDPLARLYARTFAMWTALSCAVCAIAAFHLRSKPMIWTTLASFYAVAVHFAIELSVFGSVEVEKLAPIVVVAGTSIAWLHAHLACISERLSKQE